jgi:hypothetical protein
MTAAMERLQKRAGVATQRQPEAEPIQRSSAGWRPLLIMVDLPSHGSIYLPDYFRPLSSEARELLDVTPAGTTVGLVLKRTRGDTIHVYQPAARRTSYRDPA